MGYQAAIFRRCYQAFRRWKADGQVESDLESNEGDLQMPSSGSQPEVI